jgi:hypothetical protein
MDTAKIACEMASLPPEAQKEVIDFLAFIKARYPSSAVAKRMKRAKLTDEPFIGMWRVREDMQDNAPWVRNLRQRQWDQRR